MKTEKDIGQVLFPFKNKKKTHEFSENSKISERFSDSEFSYSFYSEISRDTCLGEIFNLTSKLRALNFIICGKILSLHKLLQNLLPLTSQIFVLEKYKPLSYN